MINIAYTPPMSLALLFQRPRLFNFMVGPLGSTKTTAAIFFMLFRAMTQAPMKDGIRRTQFVISRPTLKQIVTTVLRDILYHIGPLCTYHVSTQTLHFKFNDVESTWFLIPLDTIADQQRLLSMQLSGVYINEVREVNFDIVLAAAGRVKRFPSEMDGGVTCPFVLCDTNPGAVNSDLFRFLHRDGVQVNGISENVWDYSTNDYNGAGDCLYIHQPSGLSPVADWLQYLAKDYYRTLARSHTGEWARVHIHSEWGIDPSGQAIFAGVFSRVRHVAEEPLMPHKGVMLWVPIDPGRQPGALITQLADDGQLRVYEEHFGSDVLFTQFFTNKLAPRLVDPRWGQAPVVLIMDPTAVQRHTMSNESAYAWLQRGNWTVILASTNDIQPRLLSVERRLMQNIGPAPSITIDVGCVNLIRGMVGEYRYRRMHTGELTPTPEKKHPVSDLTDCLGYGCLTVDGPRSIERVQQRMARPVMQNVAITAAGWT